MSLSSMVGLIVTGRSSSNSLPHLLLKLSTTPSPSQLIKQPDYINYLLSLATMAMTLSLLSFLDTTSYILNSPTLTGYHACTKHADIYYCNIGKKVRSRQLNLRRVCTGDTIADSLGKPLLACLLKSQSSQS